MKDHPLIEAKIIQHTKTKFGDELITMQTCAPKFLDAEIEKHRTLSSNSSSDRAIPWAKNINTPMFVPYDIRAKAAGMQGYEQLPDGIKSTLHDDLKILRRHIVQKLKKYADNVHKQHLNRYLTPFVLQKKVLTGNLKWFSYFVSLRAEGGADPAVQDLARKITHAITHSEPTMLKNGRIHLPYANESEEKALVRSVARCARVSFLNHEDRETTLQEDLKLYNLLLDGKHSTPFEHQAWAMQKHEVTSALYIAPGNWERGVTHMNREGFLFSGNFKGYIQYRQLLPELAI